jgi:hypothetical protein
MQIFAALSVAIVRLPCHLFIIPVGEGLAGFSAVGAVLDLAFLFGGEFEFSIPCSRASIAGHEAAAGLDFCKDVCEGKVFDLLDDLCR